LYGAGKTGVKKLRIWSAGCSTGEEPYTLAMVMLEERERLLQGWTFEIMATDLNDRSLETAKAGVYGSYALRNTPEYFRQKYFCAEPEGKLRINDNVKQWVSFSRVNLSDDGKMVFMKGMDLIFCCNVLIYFDLQSKKGVIQHFYANLLMHGYFFLGNSETLYQVNESFRVIHLPGTVG
jgi:chemotaxis protein methyltransferase CheR